MTESEAMSLMEHARLAASASYAPYSRFTVGAAVLLSDGVIITGTNVENASYGLTICAERSALVATISAGRSDILAIAAWTSVPTAAPCGACRQFIYEFGSDIEVVFKHNDNIVTRTISELLPFGFNKDSMDSGN